MREGESGGGRRDAAMTAGQVQYSRSEGVRSHCPCLPPPPPSLPLPLCCRRQQLLDAVQCGISFPPPKPFLPVLQAALKSTVR